MAFKQGTAQNTPFVQAWLNRSLCVTAWREVTNSLLEFDYVEEICENSALENVWFDRTVEEYVEEMEQVLVRTQEEKRLEGLLAEMAPTMRAEVNTIRAWLRIRKVMEGAIE